MSYPFIIWTEPRSVGTALSKALKAVSEHPSMFDDPFMYGGRPGLLNPVYERWRAGDRSALGEQLARRIVFKHVAANFDDDFNIALAEAAETAGYRHIHLVRCDVFAHLASRGVAEQLDAWSREETQAKSAAALRPLDVQDLIGKFRLGEDRWRALSPLLTSCLTVRSEDVAASSAARRRWAIKRIVAFLWLEPNALDSIDEALSEAGENTDALWSRVPNIEELSQALTERGIR